MPTDHTTQKIAIHRIASGLVGMREITTKDVAIMVMGGSTL